VCCGLNAPPQPSLSADKLARRFRVGGERRRVAEQVELARDLAPHALALEVAGLLEIACLGPYDLPGARTEPRAAKPGVDHDRFFGGYPHGVFLSPALPAIATSRGKKIPCRRL